MQRGQIDPSREGDKAPGINTFLLRRISIESTCPSIQADFSPITTQPTSHAIPKAEQQLRQTIPRFNCDFRYFTPAFILLVDKEKYVSHASSYLSLHQSKIVQFGTQKSELYVPRPSKLSNFCCICKAIFEDYLTHVNIPIHQQLLRSSIFNESINQMCKLYEKKQVEVIKKGRKINKKITKGQKVKKSERKQSDSLLSSMVLKLDFSEQAKTRGCVD